MLYRAFFKRIVWDVFQIIRILLLAIQAVREIDRGILTIPVDRGIDRGILMIWTARGMDMGFYRYGQAARWSLTMPMDCKKE